MKRGLRKPLMIWELRLLLSLPIPDQPAVPTLYPAYVRGQAYLAMGDGPKAAAEFRKLTDRPGLVLNYPLGALAHLGRL